MVAQKFAEMEEKAGEEFPIFVAMAADGKIWDENLGKKCSYRDLITHPDPTFEHVGSNQGKTNSDVFFRDSHQMVI